MVWERDYRILERIGEGGGGIVYRVEHRTTGQIRAAKEFHSDMTESRMRELEVLRHLKHPALPAVYDILQQDENCILIMEYIEGQTLKQLCRQKRDADLFFDFVMQLLRVIRYLHEQHPPVIHLDIKPSNLLIDREGHLWLLDFGTSVLLKGQWNQNPCAGTVGFAAPEQMDLQMQIDVRSDLYGCGAVMYWFFADKRPVRNSQGTLIRPHYFNRISCRWKRKLWKLIRKCLYLEREKRFSNVTDLIYAFEKIRNSYRRKMCWRKKIGAGLLLLLSAFGSLRYFQTERMKITVNQEQKYRKLLEQVEYICEDSLFDMEEEQMLKALLYSVAEGRTVTYMEELEQNEETYGTFCYQMGIAYWYFYEKSGGKNAAVNWFGKAVSTRIYDADWYDSAVLYTKLGAYYECLGQRNGKGDPYTGYILYWQELCRLWELEELHEQPVVICRQIAEELVTGVLVRWAELEQAGMRYGQIEDLLRETEEFARRQDMEELKKMCGMAWNVLNQRKIKSEELCEGKREEKGSRVPGCVPAVYGRNADERNHNSGSRRRDNDAVGA